MDTNVSLFKEVLGNYPTGVTVVTTMNAEGEPVGLTVNSFASVSLEPMLILWSIDKRAFTYDTFVNGNNFAVHVLAENQGDICGLFASKNVDRFANCKWGVSERNLPILEEVAGVLECETFQTIEAGDHMILIGKVVNIQSEKKEPLLYHKRNFGGIPKEFYKA
ncbi:MAG: flavin reductase family protein [Bacillaceae bacterium]